MNDSEPSKRDHSSTSWVKVILISLTIVTVVLLVVSIARVVPITNRFYTDADRIHVPHKEAKVRDILWQPAQQLSDLINTGRDDYEPRLSADGTSLLFVRGKAGENADIFISTRTPEGWSEPRPMVEINSDYDDLGPEPSADGRAIYFYSDRPGGMGGYDLWIATKSDMGWQVPINLGNNVNSEFNDYGPALSPDGTTLYFASNRPRPEDDAQPDPAAWSATLREDHFQRDYDLYTSSVSDTGVSPATPLTQLNTSHNEGAPAVSSFGDFLYFSSDRPGGQGGFDLYRARRLNDKPPIAENLGPAVNTQANELDPGLSLGGYALYFSSDRIVAPATDDSQADNALRLETTTTRATKPKRTYDLYYTTSREVYTEIENLERRPIDWATIWNAIGPNLLWALLALVLLLGMLALMRETTDRKLSLISKCLLASLMAHMLLMMMFNLMEVSSSIAKEFRRRGRIQIALASPTLGSEIARQIRGDLTNIDAPDAPEMSMARQEIVVALNPETVSATFAVVRTTLQQPVESQVDVTAEDAVTNATNPVELVDSATNLTETHTPIPTEPSLPKNSTPVASAEAQIARPQPTKTNRSVHRPVVEVQHRALTDALTHIDPTSSTAQQLIAPSISLTSEVSPGESALPTPVMVEAKAAMATLDQPAAPDVSLPIAPTDRPAETTEPSVIVATRSVDTPRRDFVPREPMAQTPQISVAVKPMPADHASATKSLAQDTIVSAVEATTPLASEKAEPSVPVNYPQAMMAMDDLALDSLETSPSSATEYVPVTPTVTTAVDSGRRYLETKVSAQPATSSLVQINPEQLHDTNLDQSLAVQAPTHVADSTTLTGSTAQVVVNHEPSLPELPDVELPDLEQAKARSVNESTQRWVALNLYEARASLSNLVNTTLGTPTTLLSDIPSLTEITMTDIPTESFPTSVSDANPWNLDQLASTFMPDTLDLALPETSALDLGLPVDEQAPDNPYSQRLTDDRLSWVERMGGSEATELAVENALAWLAAHQSEDGRWNGEDFDEHCGECGGETDIEVDRALTGLALLSFYGAGHSHVKDGPYRNHIQRGLDFLLKDIPRNGDLSGDESMYTHGIVTITLAEAYGMSRDKRLITPVRRATRYIDRARSKQDGGWRYDPGQPGDTSVLGWQIMALKSASMNGIPVPAGSFRSAREWLDRVSRRRTPGLYAYQPGHDVTPSMTAEGMFVQQLLGLPRGDKRMKESAEYISQYPPDWDDANTYYWYYATLALFQYQGPLWESWNQTLTQELLDHQRSDGSAKGSWDPIGQWADVGGRVYQTALCTLMLEVYYRYLPMYTLDGMSDAIGAIRGVVTDAWTGDTVGHALIRLDLPDRPPIIIETNADGTYHLLAPEVPDHFALSASREGYLPSSANVESARLEGTTLAVDFELRPVNDRFVALEADPEVHHLGDNRFEGKINSQFQKQSEGAYYQRDFQMSASQLTPGINQAKVILLVKGVQRSHKIRINGVLLDDRLDDAPRDGSFGEFIATFDPTILVTGRNTLEIIAKPSKTDIDDFEFVNVQIRLIEKSSPTE